MAVPMALVALVLVAVVGAALGLMAYLAWKGNKPTDFFTEAVGTTYTAADLSYAEIDAFYEMKDALQGKYAPEYAAQAAAVAAAEEAGEEVPPLERWALKVPQEERTGLQKALMKRLVTNIGKLDQVQKDRPGNWKLWQTKLISERFWNSLLESEKTVSQEIDECIAEAEEIEPGWRDHIFPQAVQIYRMQRQQEAEKQARENAQKQAQSEQKMAANNADQAKVKAVSDRRKEMEKEVRRKEAEAMKTQQEKEQEERAAKKAMEELLQEEADAEAAKKGNKKKAGAKAAPSSGGKSKPKK